MADESPSPIRVEGPTPNGGAYALIYRHDDGEIEIVEFDADDRETHRTYGSATTPGPIATAAVPGD